MASLRDMESDDLYGDETFRALQETVPNDIFNLGTPEAEKVTKYYKSHGYWLSEIYLYVPRLRAPLKKVLEQLKAQPWTHKSMSRSRAEKSDGVLISLDRERLVDIFRD